MSLHLPIGSVAIACGIVLLSSVFSKDPWVRVLKPTLIILSISGILFGAIKLLIEDPAFKGYLDPSISHQLHDFKFLIGGIGVGAAVCSLFHGHFKFSWLAKK